MKKKLFSIVAIAAIAMTSCKKDETAPELGSATITGTIRADIDQTNDLNSGGLYEWNYTPDAVEGMVVRVEVDYYDLDESPNGSFDYPKKTFTATTDASGFFSLDLPATEDGYTVTVEFDDVNGVTRKMYTTDGSALNEASMITKGNENVFIYDGANLDFVYDANISVTDASANEFGTATVKGRVLVSWDVTPDAAYDAFYGSPWTNLYSSSPMNGVEWSWRYTNAPNGVGYGSDFAFTLDGSGYFTIQVPTYASPNTSSVSISLGFDDFIADKVRQNAAMTADSLTPSVYSIGGPAGISSPALSDGDVINVGPFGINPTEL